MKIKLLNENAVVPTRGSDQAAGLDLYACKESEIYSKDTALIHTGISIEVPEGYFGGIFARSGLATKQGLRQANCVGVIDSDYRGEVMVALHNDSGEKRFIKQGDRIAQLILIPYNAPEIEVVNELSNTERGVGGFGSTGS